MRKFLIAGNWKMNLSFQEAINLSSNINNDYEAKMLHSDVLICPPTIWLQAIRSKLAGSKIQIGSQNCFYEDKGAFTGEISITMLEDINIQYSIIGHSERRHIFLENDKLINLKLKALLNSTVNPILCIGETLEERQSHKTFQVLEQQISKAFDDINNEDLLRVTLAYEPVWAIGTGVSASSEQAQEVHSFLRNFINDNYGISDNRILYGGSLNENNAEELLKMPDIDGGLIGGASLKLNSFVTIIKIADTISKD
ncbi:MAG TPA: triose-phosphate isomerase [Candidatus Kapabacteria bacterium]|nr:triose-phosphate isomerase [Candidatus Kapabacteria bacterium]